jgi:hypothetical protein
MFTVPCRNWEKSGHFSRKLRVEDRTPEVRDDIPFTRIWKQQYLCLHINSKGAVSWRQASKWTRWGASSSCALCLCLCRACKQVQCQPRSSSWTVRCSASRFISRVALSGMWSWQISATVVLGACIVVRTPYLHVLRNGKPQGSEFLCLSVGRR